jgi:hypothetical protein
MLRRAVRWTAYLFLSCIVLLCGCSTWPDFKALTAEGEANNAPIIIFGTHWTVPSYKESATKIGFINLQYKNIKSIRLFVAQCRVKGAMHDAGHVLLDGPFASRSSYIADASWSEDPDSYLVLSGVSDIQVITKIEIDEVDGSKLEYKDKDVRPLVDKSILNYCSNFSIY